MDMDSCPWWNFWPILRIVQNEAWHNDGRTSALRNANNTSRTLDRRLPTSCHQQIECLHQQANPFICATSTSRTTLLISHLLCNTELPHHQPMFKTSIVTDLSTAPATPVASATNSSSSTSASSAMDEQQSPDTRITPTTATTHSYEKKVRHQSTTNSHHLRSQSHKLTVISSVRQRPNDPGDQTHHQGQRDNEVHSSSQPLP